MLRRVYYNQEIKPKVNNHSNIKQHTHHKTTKAQKGILQSQFNQYPVQLSPKSPIFMPIQHNPTSQTSKTKQPQQINSNKKRHRESVCVPEGVGNRRETQVQRSREAATAVDPCTTACSPASMIFPGALAFTSIVFFFFN